MADVIRPVSLFEQIRLVAGLRWRILRNSLRKKNNVLDLIGMFFFSLVAALMVIGPSVGFYFAGYTLMIGGKPQGLALPFWGIFLFWQIFPIFAAGFGSNFQFRTLLRFPITGGAFYLMGLAYGLADFPAVASTCWLLALTAGAAVVVHGVLPVMLLVVALFILLNVTLERLIGSWLERLLARRRTRELFFALFILSMFSLQFISPIQRRYVGKDLPALEGLVKYLAPFPPSLSTRVILGAIRHDATNIAIGLLGIIAFIALFSALLWQRFAAQYRGEELSESSSLSDVARSTRSNRLGANQALSPASGRNLKNFFGLLSPAVGGVLRKEYSYLVRNSFGFMLLILPPAQVLLFSSQLAGKHPAFGGKGVSPDFLFPGLMAYTILVLMGPAYNAFAHEGRGIQTYFMTPVKFEDVFLGKNILTAAIVALEVFLCATILVWRTGWPATPIVCATLGALIFTVTGQLPIANWSSLSFPRKLEFGSMRNQRNSGVAVWLMLGAQIVMATISGVVLWAGRWTGNTWFPTEAFAFLAAVAFAGYFGSLPSLTQLAEKKKETLIEALCR
jgi:ABC-2 type transport system permease protein